MTRGLAAAAVAFFALAATLAVDVAAIPATPPAAVPATAATSPAEEARLRRGAALRKILLETLEQAYAADGDWPARPAAAGDPPPVYLRPTKPGNPAHAWAFTAATVAMHEPAERHPGGVWVGYADGHLEFAPTAEDLAAAKAQPDIVRAAVVEHGHPVVAPAVPPAPGDPPATAPAGDLRLRVLDPDGHPVAGALVGTYGWFGDDVGPSGRVTLSDEQGTPVTTGADGDAVVPAARALRGGHGRDEPAASLYVLHEGRGLVALEELRPRDFGAGVARVVRLRPACRVAVGATSVGHYERGRRVERVYSFLYRPGRFGIRPLGATSTSDRFDYHVPPGDYCVDVYGRSADTESVDRWVRAEPGRREVALQLDLPPAALSLMFGSPAPELRGIREWKNGGPATLAGLRGKVVLLDFWGEWCGPCVGAMPAVMALHDEFKDRGLVVVAVHDNSVPSIADMDRRLADRRAKFWGGRDLPFLVALDGGGETRIRGTATRTRGATTAAYGITAFPTTLLVSRDGTLLKRIDVHDPEAARADVAKALAAEGTGR